LKLGAPFIFSKFSKSNHPYLGNRSSDQQKNLDLRFGGQNQHARQSSLNSERVGFSPLGDLTWNDPEAKTGFALIVQFYVKLKRNCTDLVHCNGRGTTSPTHAKASLQQQARNCGKVHKLMPRT